MATEDPEVQRRRLRAELRQARKAAELTQREVAEAMDWSLSKLVRMESGTVGISTSDLRVLLPHYGIVDDDDIEPFIQMARAGRGEQAWWTEFKDSISTKYLEFLKAEGSASVIQNFEPMFIPGLLQEEEYARAVLQALVWSAPKRRIDQWVELRMRRQEELFGRSKPPEMEFVVDEAALRRMVGGRTVMRRQLRRLRTESMKDNVTIEVVPFTAGAHPGMKGPFVLLHFDNDKVDDLLFLENSAQDMSRQGKQKIKPYQDTWIRLRSLPRKKGLDEVIDEMLLGLNAWEGEPEYRRNGSMESPEPPIDEHD